MLYEVITTLPQMESGKDVSHPICLGLRGSLPTGLQPGYGYDHLGTGGAFLRASGQEVSFQGMARHNIVGCAAGSASAVRVFPYFRRDRRHHRGLWGRVGGFRITSYNVCYTKLLRADQAGRAIPVSCGVRNARRRA